MRYHHVIWDWNGTLLDDTQVVVGVMNELLTRRGLPALTIERYREIFRFPVRDYYLDAGFDFESEPFPALAAEWISAFERRWRSASLHPGTLETMGRIRDSGVRQSVLSAAEQRILEEQAAFFGVAPFVDRLVGIDDHHAESKLEHGRRYLGELGLDPSRVLLVGDTTHDVEVATALGTAVVLVNYGHQSSARLEHSGAAVFDSLDALVAPGGPLSAPAAPPSPVR